MSSPSTAKSGRVNLFGHRPFLLYLGARTLTEFASQIAVVALGWHVYALTGSAFDLGMIGLVQFLPMAALVFIAGHAADRYTRQHVVQVCQLIECVTATFLAWGTFSGWLTVHEIFAAVAVLGIAAAFESPAEAALLPNVAPEGMLQRATASATGAFQVAMISGPAFGGIAYAVSPALPFAVMASCWLLAAMCNGAIDVKGAESAKEPPTFEALFAGVKFVRQNRAILGTISLDLFAVLLGGATALLPIYARDILHTGPWGLGVLRAAPAAGALLMTFYLARHPISRRVGMRMFQAVIVFGAATVVFALSRSVVLSLIALGVAGAADTISVVIRISLVQLSTPDAMRGRVGAVNYLFINASNQLGEFESGMAAALLGAMPAAVVGGIGTIVVALLWMRLFPSLRDVERLE
ncbi:MFS transporter [Hyphomicrobium sp.]|jgi:MFS family permease|uniref:MFS transporter n=1 Tax=Hyphomicrobium sp. TaxID=82 RepID=UPI002D8065B2|nr:MFS transporter [Hyphomicrobium sp.]